MKMLLSVYRLSSTCILIKHSTTVFVESMKINPTLVENMELFQLPSSLGAVSGQSAARTLLLGLGFLKSRSSIHEAV